MKITESSLRRPVTVLMIFVSFIVIGIIASKMLPLEFFPKFEYPYIDINIPYPDSTPEEVERQITRPVEEIIATMSGIKRMTSNSNENNCGISLEFDWGVDTNVKAIEIREKIDSIRNQLPNDLERFYIRRRSMTDRAILMIRISSNRDLSNSYDLLNRHLKRRIERIGGVSMVTMYGVEKKEVLIQLIANRITAHQVDLNRLARVLSTSNFMVTAGKITDSNRRFIVRPIGELKTPEEIGNLIIGPNNLKLRDIAEISHTTPELDYGRHLNRKYAIGLDVFKESGANVVDVANKVKAEIAEISKDPKMEGINLFMLGDAADAVVSSLNELIKSGFIGAVLAILVLYIFLRQWVTTLIVVLAVPLSLLPTLAVMYFSNMSLNILSMLGLLLAVGMLVDNAVVVTENIYRHQKLNPNKKQAAIDGVNEVALAITAGTITTAIVFVSFFISETNETTLQVTHVGVSFCIALGISLILAQTVIPLLTTKIKSSPLNSKKTVTDRLALRYKRMLDWLLHHRKTSVTIILLTLITAAIPIILVKKDMFPPQENRKFYLQYNINDNYTVKKVEAVVDKVEEYLYSKHEEFEIESVYSYYTGSFAASTISLKKGKEASKPQDQIKNEIREGLPLIPIGKLAFEYISSGGGEDALRIRLTGPSTEKLIELSKKVAWTLGKTAGFVGVRSGASRGKREAQVIINRERAKKYGFSPREIARNIAIGIRGINLRRIQDEEGEIRVKLEFQREDKKNLENLRDFTLFQNNSQPVKLTSLADIKLKRGPNTIRREDRITSIGVSIDLKDLTKGEARKKITRVMKDFKFPPGYSWSFGRSFSGEAEAINTMLINTLLALVLIYFVMAALFESLIFPAAIWTSIIFAIIGVWWFFLITGTTFEIMAWFGALILIGVVVNNGIVLIDYINLLRSRGISRHLAIVQAGSHRLRPILMTAGTTVLSLLPLCLTPVQIGGDGPSYFPMARAIAGGLIFSTAVTLIILPTIYIMLDDLRNWARRILTQAKS